MKPESLLAHQDFVRALAGQLIRDSSRADDVAQETWLRVLRKEPPSEGSPRKWLARIVRNVAHDDRRHASSTKRRERERASRGTVPSTADVVEREAARKEIVDAVLSLREPYRGAILLRFYEMLPPRAIAKRLEVPVETVRTRIKRGLELLRAALGIGPGSARALSTFAVAGVTMKTSVKLRLAAALLLIVCALAPLVLDWGSTRSKSTVGDANAAAGPAVVADRARAPQEAPIEAGTAGEAPPAGVIAGQVVDEAGAAVASARIVAHVSNVTSRVGSTPGGPLPNGVNATTSGQDGRFQIPIAQAPAARRLFVEADGFAPNVLDAVAGEPVRVILERGRAVVGTVRDTDERPIAGARIQVVGCIGPVRMEREAVSAADGTFRVEAVPTERVRRGEWRTWSIIAGAPGFAPLLTPADDLFRAELGRELRFDPYLVVGAAVRGRVVDAETGASLGDAKVFLWSVEAAEYPSDEFESNNPSCPRVLDRARANAQGEFSFLHVPAEGPLPLASPMSCSQGPVVAMVGALAEGHCPGIASIVVQPDGARLDVLVKCWSAATIRGRVVDESGRPRSGIFVEAGSGDRTARQLPKLCEGAESLRATSDSDGRYVLHMVAATHAESSETTITAWRTPWGQATAKIAILAGETAVAPDLVFPTNHDPVVLITVTDARGVPIPGASIRSEPNCPAQRLSVGTDGKGQNSFKYPKDPVYRHEWRVLVEAMGFAPAMSPPFTPVPDQTVDVTVTLDPGHRLAGHAQWRNGEPAKGVWIWALDPASNPDEVLPWLYGKPYYDYVLAERAHAQTQVDGSFEVRVRAGASQRLIGPDSPVGPPSTLLVPADARDVTFVIQRDPPAAEVGAIVEGIVVEEASRLPVMRFTAQVQAGEKTIFTRRTGPGRFRATGVPEGMVTLKVRAEGFAPVEQELTLAAGRTQQVQVKVAGGITVRGQVSAPGGVRVEGTIVVFDGRDPGNGAYARVHPDGRYEAVGIAAGTYRVSVVVWEPGHAPEYDYAAEDSADLEVTSAKDQIHDIRIVKGGSIDLHIRSGHVLKLLEKRPNLSAEERATLDGLLFEVRDAQGRTLRSVKGFRESSWRLPYGTYEVLVAVPGRAPERQRVVLDSDRVTAAFDLN